MAYFESSNKKIPTCIHGRLKSFVHARRKLAQSEIQALIEIEKKDEELLAMGRMVGYMQLESATNLFCPYPVYIFNTKPTILTKFSLGLSSV